MSILTAMVKATADFFVLIVLPIPFIGDTAAIGWYSVSIIAAFVLRLGIEYNNNTLTVKSALIQTVYTISLCWFAILLWFSFLNFQKGFEIYLFVCALFAVFIVGEGKKLFEMGFTPALRMWLRGFLAKEDKEAKP